MSEWGHPDPETGCALILLVGLVSGVLIAFVLAVLVGPLTGVGILLVVATLFVVSAMLVRR